MERDVVKLERHGKVALVRMEDKQAGNTLTGELIAGLHAAFDEIGADESLNAVVLCGYGPYFCCGGTKEDLLGILEGRIRFVDMGVFKLLLHFKLPVIAAMQGHALGGGLALGCAADFQVLGRENVYAANFMKFGFTPGMGATLFLPRVFGEMLGNDMLYTSHSYRGQQLAERGIAAEVVPKAEVVDAAMKRAQELADKSRKSLILLKDHLTEAHRARLPVVIEKELAMHDQTFNQPGIRERILANFGR